jgi:toxin ParE1/3/4
VAYLVSLAERALKDLAYLYDWVNVETSQAAAEWYNGLETAIYTLEKYPNRCPLTSESYKLRQLLYGRKPHIYRVIYRVLENRRKLKCSIYVFRYHRDRRVIFR